MATIEWVKCPDCSFDFYCEIMAFQKNLDHPLLCPSCGKQFFLNESAAEKKESNK